MPAIARRCSARPARLVSRWKPVPPLGGRAIPVKTALMSASIVTVHPAPARKCSRCSASPPNTSPARSFACWARPTKSTRNSWRVIRPATSRRATKVIHDPEPVAADPVSARHARRDRPCACPVAERQAIMATNTIKQLHTEQDQSVWQDDISRDMLQQGILQQRIDEIGVRGVTSNPTIFQKAISSGTAYDDDIKKLLSQGKTPEQIFQSVAVQDIRDACDLFRPIYDESDGADGFVSIEVLPSLARDAEGTIDNARVLWGAVDRPNLMVKVPGTDEGVAAIETLLTEGININITLLFSLRNYERVAKAYIAALDTRHAQEEPIDRLASVASFFVSRVDTLADKKLDEKAAEADADQDKIASLKGKVAVANAQLAYETFQHLFGSEQFKKLEAAGARVQRPLWASTGTKNPDYSDVLYVKTLIGPRTVNTMPVKTMEAFLDHGVVKRTVDADYAGAHKVADDLASVGISIDEITSQLESDGIDAFIASYDDLLAGVDEKRSALAGATGDA